MSDSAIREELRISKHELERLSGLAITTVAIPNGAVDSRVRRIALELGYTLIFTSETHVNSHWTGPTHIGRAAIRRSTSSLSATELAEGDFGMEPIRRMVLSLPKRILGPQRYRRMRAWWMGEKSSQKEMHDLCPTHPVYDYNPVHQEPAGASVR